MAEPGTGVGRRQVTLGAAALALSAAAPARAAVTPTVATDAGKVSGLSHGDVCVFKGIPYAASTAGTARFMPPAPAKPWTDIRPAVEYGPKSPQAPGVRGPSQLRFFAPYGGTDVPGEDCLCLNVWTPGLDGGKRPVMLWIHGGGLNEGSGAGPEFDGEALSRRNDVVVLTVNHRLNSVGYLHLGELGGDAFADSSNAGQLDLIAALRWVRTNIAGFGGDPANVTVFGQSGGGYKISLLLAMPAAAGLFHRAIIESGPLVRAGTPDAGTAFARLVLTEAGLAPRDVAGLQALPIDRLEAATKSAIAKYRGAATLPKGLGLAPVVGSPSLPTHPFDPAAPAVSADVPLMIGHTRTETSIYLIDTPDLSGFREADVVRALRQTRLGADSQSVYDAYRSSRPNASVQDLYTAITTDITFGAGSITIAERRAALGRAPTFFYTFDWATPVMALGSPHTLEIPFVFDTLEVASSAMLGPVTPSMRALQATMSDTWVAFARTGNPNNRHLPDWPAYDAQKRATMSLNVEPRLLDDPSATERQAMNGA